MPETEYLYHGTSRTIVGDSLVPSAHSTMRKGGQYKPLVYANSNLGGAYAYALMTDNTVVLEAVGNQPYIVIKDKDKFERDFKGGAIYKFPSRLFNFSMPVTLASCIDEWVSDKPVLLSSAVEVVKVPDIETAMQKGGVKVYFLSDPAQSKQVGSLIVAAENKDGPNHTAARTELLNRMVEQGVLTVAGQQAKSFAPDLSLIRDYTHTDEKNYRPVACTHFTDGTKHLYDINASHVAGTDNATCKTIERAIEEYKPQLVIVEGVPTSLDVYSSGYTDYLKRQAALHFRHGEPDYAAALAKQKNIPFIGGEPTDNEITQAMKAKGYAPKDIMAFYALRWIPQDRREGKAMDEAHFAKRMQERTAQCFDSIVEKDRLTFEEFKVWYDRHNTTSKPFLAVENNDMAPFASADATYFQKMSADTGRVREEHLDKLIANSLAVHDKVLAIYGDGHLQVSRPVYERMLGQGEAVILASDPNIPMLQGKFIAPAINIDIEIAAAGTAPVNIHISVPASPMREALRHDSKTWCEAVQPQQTATPSRTM